MIASMAQGRRLAFLIKSKTNSELLRMLNDFSILGDTANNDTVELIKKELNTRIMQG